MNWSKICKLHRLFHLIYFSAHLVSNIPVRDIKLKSSLQVCRFCFTVRERNILNNNRSPKFQIHGVTLHALLILTKQSKTWLLHCLNIYFKPIWIIMLFVGLTYVDAVSLHHPLIREMLFASRNIVAKLCKCYSRNFQG